MSDHIPTTISSPAWILHNQINKKYYEVLERVKDMYDFSYLLKKTLNGNKEAEQISEDVFEKVVKLLEDLNGLPLVWRKFDSQGFKKKYD